MCILLHIETSTDVCSVSLSNRETVLDTRETTEGRSHASLLAVFIEELLKRNQITVSDLAAVAVGMGPGSYTGLRIGVSAAKGICYGAGIPLISVPSLESMCIGFMQTRQKDVGMDEKILYAPMIDARRMEVYMAVYRHDRSVFQQTTAQVVDHNTFDTLLAKHKVYFFGSGTEKLRTTISNQNAYFISNFKISSSFMPPVAYSKYTNNDFEDVAYCEPFYLKDFIATIPKKNVILHNKDRK